MDLIPYHYVSLFRENIAKYPKREILMAKNEDSNQWEGISWEAVGDITTRLSRALLGMGILAQDKVGILSQNMPQWTLADLACLQIRAISVPIYTTNTAEQALYVMNHAEIKVLFVSDELQYNKALEVAERCASLQK